MIAHEFGHLSGNHSRFKGWIYRVRATWGRVTQAYEGVNSLGARLMFKFFNWYSRRFSAYSFALARVNEYEADAIATQITSPHIIAEALANTYVTSGYVDKDYWAQYFKKADTQPEPGHAPWQGLTQFINERRLSQQHYAERLNAELAHETSYYDTHPSLKDRAAALKVTPKTPAAVTQTAAALWLGDRLQQVIADFDSDWLQANGENWRNRYQYVADGKNTLAELAQKEISDLSDDELWHKATLSEEFIGDDAACPDHMKTALDKPQLALDACRYAYRFLEEHEPMQDTAWWEDRYNEHSRVLEESQQERAQLKVGEPLAKAALSAEALADIANSLKANKNVKRVWLAQKQLKHYPEYPALAFAVQVKGFVMDSEKRAMEIIQSLNLDCDFFAISKSGNFKKLAKQIIKAGERIV